MEEAIARLQERASNAVSTAAGFLVAGTRAEVIKCPTR
ncbi:hypothetical protein NOC27_397 [Nitrosococcus oceani AFC27]|nr:hypothetical protein NOC27_397 [Nitrosococcus oceani AFC27]